MRKIIPVCILVIMVIFSGCTSYFSNLTAPKKNLQLNEYAVFEKEGNKFTAEITGIKGVSSGSRLYQVDITIRVKGAGTKEVSLVAYPSLSDPSGEVYWGKNIFIGTISPGGEFTGKSAIPIPSDDAYNSLKKGAKLNLRFQDTKLIPYEGTWDIDITKI